MAAVIDLTPLKQLLTQLRAPDNALRNAAESSMHTQLSNAPMPFVLGLAALMSSSIENDMRAFCAILLRKKLTIGEPTLFDALSDEAQQELKSRMLHSLAIESDAYVRRQIADAIAELATILLFRDQWLELVPFIARMMREGNENFRVLGLWMMGKLTDALDSIQKHLAVLHPLIVTSLSDPVIEVQVEAIKTLCKVLAILEAPSDLKLYSKPLPDIVHLLESLVINGKDEEALAILTALVELVREQNGELFKSCLDKYGLLLMLIVTAGTRIFTSLPTSFRTMMHTELFQPFHALIAAKTAPAHDRPVGADVRHMAMELMISFCEDQPRLVRRTITFITSCIISCFTLMLSVDSVALEQWALQDEEDDEDSFEVGESSAYRLGDAIKGAMLAPITMLFFDKLITDVTEWQYLHAALRMISAIGIVLPFEKLPLSKVTELLSHPHPRVRYGAVQCIGQWAIEFRPHMQETWHNKLFHALIPSLIDARFPRLQSHTATCLMHLCDELDESIMILYASQLLDCLLNLLTSASTSQVQVQEQVMSTIAAIATSAPSVFQSHSYYERVVALMKQVITQAKGSSLAMLRAKAMESITVVGMNVPKELFHKDACELMQIFLDWMNAAEVQRNHHSITMPSNTSASPSSSPIDLANLPHSSYALTSASSAFSTEKSRMGLDADDVSEQYMMQAWSRICTVLGEEFTPMLNHLLPRVFAAASQTINFSAFSHETDDGHDEEAMVEFEDMTTSQMEEKVQALCMLNSMTHDLVVGMLPHLSQCTKICVPLMSFALNSEVRMYAISLMPLIVNSAVKGLQDSRCELAFVSGLLHEILTAMLSACRQERESRLLRELVKALQECVTHVRDIGIAQQVIDQEGLAVLSDAMLSLLNASGERISQKEKEMKAEEDDDEGMDEDAMLEMELSIEQEDILHFTIADAIGTLIQSHQSAFVPTFVKLLPALQTMLNAASFRERKVAIFLFDDLVENAEITDEIASKLFPVFLPVVYRHVGLFSDDDKGIKNEAPLRQACAYGVGLCASYCPAVFAPWADSFLARLAPVIQERMQTRSLLTSATDERKSDSDAENNYNDVDNVISAYGKIALMTPNLAQPQLRPYEQHLDLFIQALPILDDREEGRAVHRVLLALVDAAHPLIERHVTHVLFVLSLLYGSDCVTEETNARIKYWLLQFKTQHAQSLEEAARTLSSEQRSQMQRVMQSLAA